MLNQNFTIMTNLDVFDAVNHFFSQFELDYCMDANVSAGSVNVYFNDLIPTIVLTKFGELCSYLDTHDYCYFISVCDGEPYMHIYRKHRFVSPE